MLFLHLEAGPEDYLVSTSEIVDIVPSVPLLSQPMAPDYVAGILNYRGKAVPVVDLNIMLGGEPLKDVFANRIVVCRYPCTEFSGLLAVRARNVTSTREIGDESLQSSGINLNESPWLGKLSLSEEGRSYQVIRIESLLTDEAVEILSRGMESA